MLDKWHNWIGGTKYLSFAGKMTYYRGLISPMSEGKGGVEKAGEEGGKEGEGEGKIRNERKKDKEKKKKRKININIK